MRSLISEFSYGFALTHELVLAMGSLTAAPIFPSLIEEGRAGGGYDVKLEAPGIPLFLQFKRSECMKSINAREIQAGAALELPYYRMQITAAGQSEQHAMLIALDCPPNLVFYAAPMFHRKAEFDDAFSMGAVRQRSFYVRPTSIGSFADNGPHHVSFDGKQYIVMSEPKKIAGFGLAELEALFQSQLASDRRPLRSTVKEALREAQSARSRVRETMSRAERQSGGKYSVLTVQTGGELVAAEQFRRLQEAAVPPISPPAQTADPDRAELRQLADIGLREFDAQLYVIQAKPRQSEP